MYLLFQDGIDSPEDNPIIFFSGPVIEVSDFEETKSLDRTYMEVSITPEVEIPSSNFFLRKEPNNLIYFFGFYQKVVLSDVLYDPDDMSMLRLTKKVFNTDENDIPLLISEPMKWVQKYVEWRLQYCLLQDTAKYYPVEYKYFGNIVDCAYTLTKEL